MILKIDFALNLSNYTSLKRFISHSQMNPKKFSIILHSQFNYHTLPVTPFKGTESVILIDPLRNDGNSRFTTIPLEALPDQE